MAYPFIRVVLAEGSVLGIFLNRNNPVDGQGDNRVALNTVLERILHFRYIQRQFDRLSVPLVNRLVLADISNGIGSGYFQNGYRIGNHAVATLSVLYRDNITLSRLDDAAADLNRVTVADRRFNQRFARELHRYVEDKDRVVVLLRSLDEFRVTQYRILHNYYRCLNFAGNELGVLTYSRIGRQRIQTPRVGRDINSFSIDGTATYLVGVVSRYDITDSQRLQTLLNFLVTRREVIAPVEPISFVVNLPLVTQDGRNTLYLILDRIRPVLVVSAQNVRSVRQINDLTLSSGEGGTFSLKLTVRHSSRYHNDANIVMTYRIRSTGYPLVEDSIVLPVLL